jgi:hypothetical protein
MLLGLDVRLTFALVISSSAIQSTVKGHSPNGLVRAVVPSPATLARGDQEIGQRLAAATTQRRVPRTLRGTFSRESASRTEPSLDLWLASTDWNRVKAGERPAGPAAGPNEDSAQ